MKRMFLLMLAAGLIVFAPLTLGGWTTLRLTWTWMDSLAPEIAVDSAGRLHVVWNEYATANSEIYYKKSTDGGMSWTASQRLTWTSGLSFGPDIAVDSSDYLHVVWSNLAPGNAEIYYKRSTDAGATWTTSRRLSWSSGESEHSMIAADSSGRLHVVWQDETAGNEEIYYKRSTDGGATWATSQRFTWNGADSLHPVIAVGLLSDIHLAWWDGASGGYEIYHKKSTDGGATWTAGQRLTWSSGGPESPSLAVDSTGGLHLAWHDPVSGNYEVYYKKSTDGGATWTTSQRLTWTSGTSQFPVLAYSPPGLLHLVWQDSTPGNNEIYHKLSANAGETWEAADRLTWSSGDSAEPAIAAHTPGYLRVVFADGTPINHDIYFKSGAWKLAAGTGVRE